MYADKLQILKMLRLDFATLSINPVGILSQFQPY